MRLISLTICRNEAWSIRASLTAALRWCDGAVVVDHCSTDGTRDAIADVAAQHPGRVRAFTESDPVWHEMAYRQRTLEEGRAFGGDVFAVVDADEVLCETLVPTIRGYVEALNPGEVLQPPWVTLWRSLDAYRSDPASQFSRAAVSMALRDIPGLAWTVHDNGYDFHMRHAGQATWVKPWTDFRRGGLMHFQHANWRRLLAKQLLYELIEIDRYGFIRANYRGTVNEDGLETTPVPAEWWGPERSLIDLDAEPWQVAECKRRLAENGRAKYAACGLLPVVEAAGVL